MLYLFPEVLVLLSQQLDFTLSFKQSAREVVFLRRNDSDVVLHVAELYRLLLKLQSGFMKFLSLVVKFTLNFVNIGV